MIITVDILKKIAPGGKKTKFKLFDPLVDALNEWLPKFGIDSNGELCHFLAQASHETDSFNTLEEYASGKAYEGRSDLGNTVAGYGVKYKGKGIFQTTGYFNYARLEGVSPKYSSTRVPFIQQPELLLQPKYAVWSAGLFWTDRDLNDIANMPDTAKIWVKRKNRNMSPIEYITYRINGGSNGIVSRKLFYDRCKSIIV